MRSSVWKPAFAAGEFGTVASTKGGVRLSKSGTNSTPSERMSKSEVVLSLVGAWLLLPLKIALSPRSNSFAGIA